MPSSTMKTAHCLSKLHAAYIPNHDSGDMWHVVGLLTSTRGVQDSRSAPTLVYEKVQAVYIQLTSLCARQQEAAVKSIPAPKQ